MKRFNKRTFLRFERIKNYGGIDIQDPKVRKILELSKKDYTDILQNYSELKQRYMGV